MGTANRHDRSSPGSPPCPATTARSEPQSAEARLPGLSSFVRFVFRRSGARTLEALALQVVMGALGGFGLLMLVPFLHVVGLESGQERGVTVAATRVLDRVGFETGLALGLIGFTALTALIAWLRRQQTVLNAEIVRDLERRLRVELCSAMARADWTTISRHRASETAHVFNSDVGRITHATQELLFLAGNVVVASVSVAVALYLSLQVTALTLAVGAVFFVLLERQTGVAIRSGNSVRTANRHLQAAMLDHLSGVKVSKSYGLEDEHIARFAEINDEIMTQTMSFVRLQARAKHWQELGLAVLLCVFLYFAAVVRGVAVAELVVLILIFSRLLPRIASLQQNWQRVVHYLPAFAGYRALLGEFEDAREIDVVAADPLGLEEAIRLEGVTFRYSAAAAPALSEVDMEIPARKITAIVGPSGAGKSTLADLLMGLVEPGAGALWVDGVRLTRDNQLRWRRSVGYVPQDTFLFHDTIRANLLCARPEAGEGELWEALRRSASDGFVRALPSGLDTVVGDRGLRFSGGERQRIALARALLRRPSLLLLDEATSALDAENERCVREAIRDLQGALTVVIIAHRLSTVREADHLVVLEAGRVVETGSWQSLAEVPDGRFHSMLVAGTGW
jgi:ATP-binding cassette, subfamily C, bacterial